MGVIVEVEVDEVRCGEIGSEFAYRSWSQQSLLNEGQRRW